MGKFRGLDGDEGWINRKLADLQRQITEQAGARRLVIATSFVQADLNSTDLPDDAYATDFLAGPVMVPEGFTFAVVTIFASAGTTFTGTGAGNVGVRPWAGSVAGPAIATGKTGGGAISVNSTLATRIPVTPGGSFIIKANALANGNPRNAGSGNVHISASILFVRG